MDAGATGGGSEGSARERRIVLRVVEALNLVFLAVDLAVYGVHAPRVLLGRLVVSGGLLAADLRLSAPGPARTLVRDLSAAVLVVVAGFALLASGTGGSASPYYAFLGFAPLVLTIMIPDEPVVVLCEGLGGTATGLAFALREGASPARLAFTLATFGSCTFYGTVSALLYRRMRRREAAAAAAREEAQAGLARSERLRLEAERLAAVGRLAAGFRHEVSSPLASAISNLGFLDEELTRAFPGPEAAQALGDARDALGDSREALGRIRRLLTDLRDLTAEAAWHQARADLAWAAERAVGLAAARLGPLAQVERSVPGGLPAVVASPDHLAQVLCLVLCAAAEPGAGRPGPAPLALRAEVVADGVRVVVEDRLRGEATARAPGAAAAAARAEPEEAGLSLGLCRELAERWGGRFETATAPDGARRFALTLALAAA